MFRIGGKADEAELREAKELAKKSVWFQAKLFMGTIVVLRLSNILLMSLLYHFQHR